MSADLFVLRNECKRSFATKGFFNPFVQCTLNKGIFQSLCSVYTEQILREKNVGRFTLLTISGTVACPHNNELYRSGLDCLSVLKIVRFYFLPELKYSLHFDSSNLKSLHLFASGVELSFFIL